jgi:hypothetical protein
MTSLSTRSEAGVGKAPRHEIGGADSVGAAGSLGKSSSRKNSTGRLRARQQGLLRGMRTRSRGQG